MMKAFFRKIGSHPGVVALGRALDIFGLSNQTDAYRHSQNPMRADADAIAGDWQAVGDDLRQTSVPGA